MKGKAVLISGSSSGIGRETAYRFARAGARVALTYCRGRAKGEAAERKCLRLGAADTLLLRLDVTDLRSVRVALGRVKRRFGRLDVLVNNAGVGVWKPFKEQGDRDIEKQLRTNLEGLVRMTGVFLPVTREAVVNIASYLGKHAEEGYAVYCASKFGVRAFTQALAAERPGLKVFCVNPDLTSTRLTGFEGRPPAEVADVIFRAVAGEIVVEQGGDVDIWEVLG